MRIVVLGNNRVACECTAWLREQGEDIVGLVVHADDRSRFRDELIAAAAVPAGAVFYGDRLRQPETVAAIAGLQPDMGLSLFFGYIVRPEVIELFPKGLVNLHPSYLPYNRGQYPNVWSIVEGTPAGATLHYIDVGVDTGDIIAQTEVQVAAVDTGETLYRRLEAASVALFRETWPALRMDRAPRRPQSDRAGTFHRTSDVERIDEIDLEREYRARDLINILRARTFRPHRGAFFRVGGRRIYLRLELIPEDELDKGQ